MTLHNERAAMEGLPSAHPLSQPGLRIRIRRASRRGRGGVFDLAIEVDRAHALILTLLGNF